MDSPLVSCVAVNRLNLLGLDVGDKRIGVAMGQSEMRLAVPVRVLTRESPARDAQVINALVNEYDASRIIVGLPLLVDGSEGEQAGLVRAFVAQVREQIPTPIEFFDERYSTVEAIQAHHQAGKTEKAGRAKLDASAAAIMLQTYIDSR